MWLIHTCWGLNLDTGGSPWDLGKDGESKSVSNNTTFDASACFAVFSKSYVNSITCTMPQWTAESVNWNVRILVRHRIADEDFSAGNSISWWSCPKTLNLAQSYSMILEHRQLLLEGQICHVIWGGHRQRRWKTRPPATDRWRHHLFHNIRANHLTLHSNSNQCPLSHAAVSCCPA
jgi:hypothetical protein